MAIPHAFQGMPVDLQPAEESLAEARTVALVKNNSFEAIRLILPRGHEVCHEHEVKGPVTVQCLKGRVALAVDSRIHDLPAGHWLYLMGGTPHTLRAVDDSVVLLTLMFH